MILILFFINLVLIISGLCSKNIDNKDGDEKLKSFWKNLRGIEQKIWYANEVYQRNKLNI
jgi:hypothetical protein